MSIGIYKIENLINHKIYIGQSIHIEKRWQEHCRQSNNRQIIDQEINKLGKENFSFTVIEECSKEKLTERENFYISFYNSLIPNGYNMIGSVDGNIQLFLYYDKDVFFQIINDIKNTEISFKDIAKKYNLDVSMIYYINRGDYHTLENETYPLRPVKDFSKKHHYCIDCGIEIGKGATRCVKCGKIFQRKCERPSREVLKDMIRTMTFVDIAKEYSVAPNTIKKWCKGANLPFMKREIKKYTDEEWELI